MKLPPLTATQKKRKPAGEILKKSWKDYVWRSKFSSSARWFHIRNFSFPGWKLSTASCRTFPALNHERGCSLMIHIILALLLKWNIFWWIMQCQPSPHRTHLNKCRFEILKDEASVSEWFTTPCKCSVISSRSFSKKCAVKFKKHSRKTRPSLKRSPRVNSVLYASCHCAYCA